MWLGGVLPGETGLVAEERSHDAMKPYEYHGHVLGHQGNDGRMAWLWVKPTCHLLVALTEF